MCASCLVAISRERLPSHLSQIWSLLMCPRLRPHHHCPCAARPSCSLHFLRHHLHHLLHPHLRARHAPPPTRTQAIEGPNSFWGVPWAAGLPLWMTVQQFFRNVVARKLSNSIPEVLEEHIGIFIRYFTFFRDAGKKIMLLVGPHSMSHSFQQRARLARSSP